MNETLIVKDLKKTFTLSKKQQRIERTKDTHRRALDGLSFTAYKGETFGLLGPNGAGKTTTLRIISTLIPMDSGSASVCGCDVISQSAEVRKRIGFLTGDHKLEERFTPDYLLGFFGRLYGMDRDSIEARKKFLFEKFGVDKYAEVKIAQMSSGMRQKVSLIMSIIHDPEVVIFDEPTNGLDVIAAKAVTDYLKDVKSQGKTIILSTHIFSLVEKLCDRVGIIIDGKLAVCDTLSEITRERSLEDEFFRLYEQLTGERT